MDNLIGVVTHKKTYIPKISPYIPVIVGNHSIIIENAFYDNNGENIASKNDNYCELTALYWMWKNIPENYCNLGLCHYRRFFGKRSISKKETNYIDNNFVTKIMKQYDIILPDPIYMNITVKENYYKAGVGRLNDIEVLLGVLKENDLDGYQVFLEILQDKKCCYCNMFITSKILFMQYCEWLFSILDKIEPLIDLSGYSVQEARVFGYLAELLLNVWVRKMNLKVKYMPIIQTDSTRYITVKRHIKHIVKRRKLK